MKRNIFSLKDIEILKGYNYTINHSKKTIYITSDQYNTFVNDFNTIHIKNKLKQLKFKYQMVMF